MFELDLKGRRVVVAGGSRGLGLHTALAFAKVGASVSVCARGATDLETARAGIAAHGAGAHSGLCDLADLGSIEAYVGEAATALGGIDILVNNATGKASSDTEQDWADSLSVDVLATVRASRAAQPFLEQGKNPVVINISSRSAFGPARATPAYGAAKAAVMHFTQSQAAALAGKGIRVNCVAPSSLEFPGGWWDKCRNSNPELYQKTKASFPFGRFGAPEDITRVILFLASPLSGWITGQTLLADGGQTLQV
ncbi:3-oxoacyl-[acyl-carrier protein] reductase [Aminobacter lissarensis]|uniref:3-oxoacyl-[acyl-carrier protein] reductase n=1 Tax=Aminobacter carboxidus TaxID=376165 RepID=A0A8E1WHC7_9HYPH|nr:SDR family oxidoreductase [Aminobacter lissarensis]MBB6468557.1 3-oxoacyl-[acyl-carrier protein] reductase [Aminobacter lissarensis]